MLARWECLFPGMREWDPQDVAEEIRRMRKPNEGGPAFPCRSELKRFSGMTLRDWFAGQAVAGTLAQVEDEAAHVTAAYGYRVADAMLAEREKGGEDA